MLFEDDSFKICLNILLNRRANANQNALEEARTLLEQADRNREFQSENIMRFAIDSNISQAA